jgi:hypothetical protein
VTQADRAGRETQAIELRVDEVAQLFHTLDPFPFRERDLDASVEEFVVGWAGELPRSQPLRIRVHLPPAELAREEAGHIGDAIRNYFSYRAEVASWELHDLFRNGRISLAIGLAVLAACVTVGAVAGRFLPSGYLRGFFNEGLVIVGWVANWRPIETFLYDWAPIIRRRDLRRRLARAVVDVTSAT